MKIMEIIYKSITKTQTKTKTRIRMKTYPKTLKTNKNLMKNHP